MCRVGIGVLQHAVAPGDVAVGSVGGLAVVCPRVTPCNQSGCTTRQAVHPVILERFLRVRAVGPPGQVAGSGVEAIILAVDAVCTSSCQTGMRVAVFVKRIRAYDAVARLHLGGVALFVFTFQFPNNSGQWVFHHFNVPVGKRLNCRSIPRLQYATTAPNGRQFPVTRPYGYFS